MITSKGILYIEPKQNRSKEPVIDSYTKKMTAAFRKAIPSRITYRGWHTCRCGAKSTNRDFILPNLEETNNLCIHYLAFHRNEVSEEQLNKVNELNFGEEEPTIGEMK